MFSATDVANFLACHQLLSLDRAHALGEIERPYFPDPGIELLRELGAKHEQSYLRHQLCLAKILSAHRIKSLRQYPDLGFWYNSVLCRACFSSG